MRSTIRTLGIAWLLLHATPANAQSPPPTLLLQIHGSSPAFGLSVANVGDVNGDGFEDILVGGDAARLYFGGPRGDGVADLVLSRPSFGWTVSGGGDLNGDGYSDFGVSTAYDPGVPGAAYGSIYIYLGGAIPDAEPDLILSERLGFTTRYGPSFSLESDVNGDGLADIVVGAPGSEIEGGPIGRAYVYFGGATLGVEPDLVLEQPQPWHNPFSTFDGFGSTVAVVGDVNGDGTQDILVTQPSAFAPDPAPHGRAALFLGGSTVDGVSDQLLKILPSALIQPPSRAGDFNADGIRDILVSAPFVDERASSLGRAYVYFGSSPLKPDYPEPDLALGTGVQSQFGVFLNGGRDLNGDGISDLIVGMPGRDYVYMGGANPDDVADIVIDCGSPRDLLGSPLAAADWNADGVADVIVGTAHVVEQDGNGSVYIFDVSVPLTARAFTRSEHRAVSLAQPGALALHLQSVGHSYENDAVDPTTLRLVSEGTGTVTEIAPISGKTVVEEDSDHDGVPELVLSFAFEDLRQLFSSLRGRQDVEAAVEGQLLSQRHFRAPITLVIVGTGKPEQPSAHLSPNPLNPQGTLEFTMPAPGPVSLRLYDVAGRCVRTILQGEAYAGGINRVPIAAHDDHGFSLASGVYFYRLELPEGVQRGRFVVAK